MKIGIKTGYENGIELLEKTGAKYCEIWFRLDWRDKYQKLFDYMQSHDINFGLHFWATVKNKYFPNLTYWKDGIADETEKLIKESIEVAADVGAFYVNFHPESLRLAIHDLDNHQFTLVPDAEVDETSAFRSLSERCGRLKEYGSARNVETYVETVPYRVPGHYREGKKEQGRLQAIEIKGIGNNRLAELGRMGQPLCFDIGHAIGQYPDISRELIWEKVMEDARMLAPYTRLIHINTVIPPFNGTDSHNGILDEDFSAGVLPDKKQFLELMDIFRDKNVLLVPEPQIASMERNYYELVELLG